MAERYPKRLIEVDLPIKRISAHARREKSIRHGHISTLHIWWARRPLAACRAVICAALWPDPADELCPENFRAEVRRLMIAWAEQHLPRVRDSLSEESSRRLLDFRKHPSKLANNLELRAALLDFIADFANWDNSTVPEFIATSRALTQAAHQALTAELDARPLVVDPFAGGGSIPLEALRVGADAFASDLNPVAVLLNRVMLDLLPRQGRGVLEDFRKWGRQVGERAEGTLAGLFPNDSDGSTPIAYLWARTIHCEGPGCGAQIPLIRSLWLAKKANRSVALQLLPNREDKRIDVRILTKRNGSWRVEGGAEEVVSSPTFEGTVRRGAATCPCCGYTTPATQMRKQLIERKGGTRDARLLCVISTKADTPGRFYRLPSEKDMEALKRAKKLFADLRFEDDASSYGIPNEPTPEGKGKGAGRAFSQRNYGMEVFADLYTERQLLTLMTLAKIIRNSSHEHIPETVRILSAFALGRVNDLSMSLCRWLTSIEAVAAANGGQNRMPVVLDFVEVNPFGGSGGDWHGQVDWVARVVEHLMASDLTPGSSVRSSAQNPALPDDSADALITDPPYYDAFPYSDLSDFFFIWLKRALGNELLDFGGELVPKNDEAVVYDVAHGGNEIKDRKFFQREMTRAFTAWRAVTKPNGVGVVVFANKTTAGWEALIQSIIDAGWIATGSWPIDTERPNRQRAIGSAALGSSVHVVCRPREFPDGKVRSDEIGDWRDVLLELPRRIHEWMPRLASEGVVGADAIFACLGPALEIFSRYSRVEKASGENVELGEYLQEVWACVAKEALAMVFDGADATGFESDARLTAMWLWTIKGGDVEPVGDDGGAESSRADDDGEHDNRNANITGYTLEYDAARKIAQGLGASLEELVSLVHVSGETARLLSAAERTKHLFGKEETELSDTSKKHRKKSAQLDMFAELTQSEDADTVWTERTTTRLGETTLDRVHQSMILFAAGRSEALKRFLVEDGVGRDGRFWRLAQALSALFPANSDEKRWVDGVLARKKGLGF